jgi:PAS domain S-box-containing protein
MAPVFQLSSSNKTDIDNRVRNFFATSGDPIVLVNKTGLIEFVNKRTEKCFGYNAAELLHQPIEILIPNRFMKLYKIGSQQKKLDLLAAKKDGSSFPVDISFAPIKTDAGTMFAAHIRDMSDYQKEVQLREDMMGIVSHDLKNPLAAIKMSNQLLQKTLSENQDNQRAQRLTENIKRSASQMERLINDLLNYAKLESGSLAVEKACHPADLFLRDGVKMIQHHLDQKKIKIDFKIAADLPDINYDLQRMTQVLYNLVGNAIKFSNENATILVSAIEHKQEILYSVEDQGQGIKKQNLEHIFEKFWQEDGSSKAGCGLGLFITKGLVTAHSGKIWVESEIGRGTRFFFTLPIR